MYVPTESGELIKAYDHRLELRWIPRDKRQPGDSEFAVIEMAEDGREYVAFLIQDESFVDERLLGRIYAGDNKDKNVGDEAEAHNRAVRDLQQKQAMDELAEQHDLAVSMMRSQLHTYRHNGKKIDL
jgi:hypothetical protein